MEGLWILGKSEQSIGICPKPVGRAVARGSHCGAVARLLGRVIFHFPFLIFHFPLVESSLKCNFESGG
jgi:hypothetical protein